MRFLILLVTLVFSLDVHALILKAAVVDENKNHIGYYSLKDLDACGKRLGSRLIAEGPIGTTGSLFVDCRSSQIFHKKQEWFGSEVRTLVNQGPSENRIDLVIAGDGFTEQEKEKFFEVAEKITQDLFGDETFATYLPLFNVHAVFVPSAVSGIGDGEPKKTALSLYRHPTIRQAVIPGDQKAARRATELAPDVDYPILVGNDPFYGGLGGAFAVTTSSPRNLTTVLRHELGHNFGRVGEEYDGGFVYEGANFSQSEDVGWDYFVEGKPSLHRAKLLHYSAPWVNLKGKAWSISFDFPEGYQKIVLDFNGLGFDSPKDVEIVLDGTVLKYDGEFNYDRNFYVLEFPILGGKHVLTIREAVSDGNNILSKVNVYALPEGYPTQTSLTGAFLNFNSNGNAIGYRPTESFCLMRNMKSRKFCKPCTENMWHSFLRQVSLVDSVEVRDSEVVAHLMPLGDRLSVEWMDPTGAVVPTLNGKTHWAKKGQALGSWTLRVRLVTPEIQDPQQQKWTTFSQKVVVD